MNQYKIRLKGSDILLGVTKNCNNTKVIKNSKVTPKTASEHLKLFQEMDLITLESNGRNNIINLTDRGVLIQNHLFEVKKILNHENNN
jgi:predicted transcriptional regulator